jgi:23S rRNA (guanine745-N1)-methyltransferase
LSASSITVVAATTADVLEDVLDTLACPHCGGALARAGRSVVCRSGHSFDVARGSRKPPADGYVSLVPGSGDTAAMVAAREAFLGAGHFEPLAEALCEEAERALADGVPGCVLDLGAGTGWHLARVLERVPGRPGLALDLSKHALRRAARAHPRIGAVACDAWRRLPVRDEAAALVLSVFAPRDGREIARVLRPGGALVVGTPTDRHLGALVGSLGLLTVDPRKQDRLDAALDPHLVRERRAAREWPLALGGADVANAVRMGPSAHHVDEGELDARIAALPDPLEVTASVTISVYRRER